MRNLRLIGIVAFLLLQGLASQDKEDIFRQRLVDLSSDLDLDWLEESDRLIADGCDGGNVYEALLSRFCIAEDVDSLVSVFKFLKEQTFEIPVGEGRLFATIELRDGFMNGLQAIDAYRWKRFDAMREFARKCYQLNPAAFGMLELTEVLEDARDEQFAAISTVKIPLETKMRNIGGSNVTLAELCSNNKAVFLDFWASWCGPCLERMPELKKRAKLYTDLGVYIAAINTDEIDPVGKAKRIKKEYEMDIPWLIEPEDEPLSKALRIDSIPRVVMLDPTGQVIYNGHPDDMELKLLLLNFGLSP